MKKPVKIILPLALALVVLIALCWFFFFGNRKLTTNILLSRAEVLAENERYDRSLRYYNWAWKLMPDRSEIPQALARTYADSGNYTKAEYTLVSAISAHPSSYPLYTALCRTYVEQDKLLDAVQMLDRITDTAVKAQMDDKRPDAPEVTPESGYYTEYIEVSAKADEELVYLATDGEYPSGDHDLYAGPVTLPAGETTVIALTVDPDGLVSPATLCGYTIGGVVEEITLKDPAVEQAVRDLLKLSATDPIMSEDLWTIAGLELPDTVKTVEDLTHFTGLRSLKLQNVSGLDFSVLAQLPALEELDLSGCTISSGSLDAIATLTQLHTLRLDGCALTDISKLSTLTGLTLLGLSNNSVQDITVLSLMPKLETVYLQNNPLTNISGLSTCTKLQYLDITGCNITALGSLTGKAQLNTLQAANNQISDLSVLTGCKKLSVLNVAKNRVTDISVLTQLPALTVFRGDNNKITAIPDFDEEKSVLVRFHANYNEISDLSGLSGISTLNHVELDYNKITNIQPLAENYNLIQLDVWDNPIDKVAEAAKPLEDNSIIVNYNPNFKAE